MDECADFIPPAGLYLILAVVIAIIVLIEA
jgi:hypothetical protein